MRRETDRSYNHGAEGAMQRAPARENLGHHRPEVGRRDGDAAEIASSETPVGKNGLMFDGLKRGIESANRLAG